jgi:hypothetical protein
VAAESDVKARERLLAQSDFAACALCTPSGSATVGAMSINNKGKTKWIWA